MQLPLYTKIVGVLAPLGVLFAQTPATETPGFLEWTKLPIEMASVAALSYMAIKVIPAMAKESVERERQVMQEGIRDHGAIVDKVLAAHKEASKELSTNLTTQIKEQTTMLATAIREIKK